MFVFLPPSKLRAICLGIFCILLNFQVLAQCDNYIGNLSDEDTLYLCYGETYEFKVDSVVLMDNQELSYIFHTQKNIFESDSIITNNTSGLYQNLEDSPKEIFATAVAAETDDFGFIKFNDPCLAFSNTISIINLNPIKIESWEVCKSIKGFSFSISGGLPEFLEDSFYDVTGSHYNSKVKANDTITIETEYYNSYNLVKYEIYAQDEGGCTSTYIDLFRCSHLPVQIIFFDGKKTNKGNLLVWSYKHQLYMDSFKIEISKNGTDWIVLSSINAKGTPSEITEYEFLDENIYEQICYYRLSMIDKDRTIFTVGIIEIISSNYFKIYPTLTKNILKVVYHSIREAPFNLMIFDIQGRKILFNSEEKSLFRSYKEIDISHLPNNMYILVISSNDFTESKKFVVQR